MSVTAIVGGVVAIAKALPAIRDIITQINSRITQWELSNITDMSNDRKEKILALTHSISGASTREERSTYAKILADYTSGVYND